MEILVVGDPHGEIPDIGVGKASVILVTGDVCGDSEVVREAMFDSMDSEKQWYDILGRDEARKAVEKSLQEGLEVLQYLDSFETPVFVVPGNWDWTGDEAWQFLDKNHFQRLVDDFKNVHNINREIVQDSEFAYIGYGPCPAPEIPQYEDEKPGEQELEELKKEYREDKSELEGLFQEAERPVILLSHNVPHGTSLDKIENPDSPKDGRHYGSLIVKELIEEERPLLSVAGHMHEGYGEEQMGETLAINAGLNSQVTIHVDKDEIKTDFRPLLRK